MWIKAAPIARLFSAILVAADEVLLALTINNDIISNDLDVIKL